METRLALTDCGEPLLARDDRDIVQVCVEELSAITVHSL
jgi:hypothetical protein